MGDQGLQEAPKMKENNEKREFIVGSNFVYGKVRTGTTFLGKQFTKIGINNA